MNERTNVTPDKEDEAEFPPLNPFVCKEVVHLRSVQSAKKQSCLLSLVMLKTHVWDSSILLAFLIRSSSYFTSADAILQKQEI